MSFYLQRIGPDAADMYRDIRLTALKTDPLAFGSTYERELLLSPDDWQRRATSLDGNNQVGFFAMKSGVPCGLVACFRLEEEFPSAQVVSMWVAPEGRRNGVGCLLLEAVREWAQSKHIATLRLTVTNCNTAAIGLYRRAAFSETGKIEPYPNDPQLFEIEMTRPTAGDPIR